MQKLLGSRPLLTMEIQLEGVCYVVRPDTISRQLPVVRDSSRTDTVGIQGSRTDTVEDSPVPGVAS
jgi:hypothetical protein